MSNRKVRIGIDVGGTFTDAIMIDNESGEVIAKEKTQTTHYADEGVASGIVFLIKDLMEKESIEAEDVIFIAHGTTQATNALLEGDVAPVGVIGMGTSSMSKKEVTIPDIELAPNKFLKVFNYFIDGENITEKTIDAAIDDLMKKGAQVIVASESYSIDDNTHELMVVEQCRKKGIYATAGHEISQLYGLKTRTRTAVINGSLIPKMMETADLTEKVVKDVGISSELMIMRADGGVMSIQEVRQRPILTMLSGLAAGVAGALMYEKLTDGIFFESGGTSTDISVIKDGKVMIKNAQVGGHKTYINSLDVRTLGVAGGSMIRISDGKISDVGPRSAHLAGLEYECFQKDDSLEPEKIKFVSPLKGDSKDYAILQMKDGKQLAFTLAGAANILGYVQKGDYAAGNSVVNEKAWQLLADYCHSDIKSVATQVMDIACKKIWDVVQPMIDEYELQPEFITLVGGGGSASVVTEPLANRHNYKFKIANNAPYISTIGVAMAMLREEIEKSIINPTNDDIKKIRNEIFEKIISAGAKEESVEISINVDPQKNIVKATATGATEFKARDFKNKKLSSEELFNNVQNAFNVATENLDLAATCGKWSFFNAHTTEKKLWGLIKKPKTILAVADDEGVVVLRKKGGYSTLTTKESYKKELGSVVNKYSTYSDAGKTIPHIYLFSETRMFDYSGLMDITQIESLIEMDLGFVDNSANIAIVVVPK